MNKMATRAKNEKKKTKKKKTFKRHLLLSPFIKIAKNGFALLNKMVIRAKNRKKKKKIQPLNEISVYQRPDFKIISHQCSSYAPLPELLKWLCPVEQNGCQS